MKKIIAISLLVAACQNPEATKPGFGELRWIDLTYTFDSTTLYWPNNATGFQKHTDAEGTTPMGFYYSSYSVCAPEHGGTHLDAPVHFAEGKLSADAIPLSSLIGDAVVIDVSKKALANRDYLLAPEDLEAWEKDHTAIAAGTIVLIKTGYGQYYPNRKNYFGTALTGAEAIPELHFPGISEAAAKWLADHGVKAVGIDTPSLDFGQSQNFTAHQVLMGANIPGFENVANLDKLPATGSFVVALPMKIGGGSGGPLRVVAGINTAP